jgi:hypothetical protein
MINQDDKWAFSLRFDPNITDDDIKSGYSKPTEPPQTEKEFKKVYNELNDDEKNEGTNFGTKKKAGDKPQIPQNLLDEAGRLAVLSLKAKKGKGPKGILEARADTAVPSSGTKLKNVDHLKEEEKSPSPYELARAQPDFSGINPALSGSIASGEIDTTAPIQKSSLHEIAAQIIEKLHYMESTGKTDTVVTLKYPPAFEGSTLTLTSFHSARGEFNVMFSDLSPHAKMMLDSQGMQDSLRQALIDKGYTLHIFIATTEKEVNITSEQAEAFDRQRREQQGQQQQQQQQQQNQDEE